MSDQNHFCLDNLSQHIFMLISSTAYVHIATMRAIKKAVHSCAIIRTTESAHVFSLSHTRGGMEISKLLPLSSASMEGVFVGNLSPIKTSRSNPCNTAFYRLPSVYVTLIRTMELAIYHSLSVHATLVHTMGAVFCHSPSVHI